MIYLMLQCTRQKPGRFNFNPLPIQGLGLRKDQSRAIDLGVDLWKTQTALGARHSFALQTELRIQEHKGHRRPRIYERAI